MDKHRPRASEIAAAMVAKELKPLMRYIERKADGKPNKPVKGSPPTPKEGK